MKTYALMRRHQRARRRLLKKDPTCFYCSAELTFETSTIDHFEPTSKGGTEAASNYRLACHRCNRRKGNHPIEDLTTGLVRGYGLHIVSHVHIWRERFRRQLNRRRR